MADTTAKVEELKAMRGRLDKARRERFSEKVSDDPRDLIFMPTRAYVAGLQAGDKAPDCFGGQAEVVEIVYRGEDAAGRLYVGYSTRFGVNGARISHSLKEDQITRTVALSNRYTSAEIDRLEAIALEVR
jgi:hypothetical protein